MATLRAHREQLIDKRRRLDEALAALDAVAPDGEPAEALRRFAGNASWARWEATREKAASTAPRAPDRVSASRCSEIHAALDRDPSGERARPLIARWNALVDAETRGDAATKAAMQKAWANRRNWPDGMRRFVASLYDAEPDAWERAAAFLDRTGSSRTPRTITRTAARRSDRPAPP